MVEIEHNDDTISNGACWKIEDDHAVVLVAGGALGISVDEVCFDLEAGHRVVVNSKGRILDRHEWPRLMAHSLSEIREFYDSHES
jgi:hypothetical protein